MENKNRSFEGIETDRLRVEYINKKYAQEIFDEKKNEEVNKYLASKSAQSIEQLLSWIDSVTIDNQEKEIIQLQTSEKETGIFTGLCGIKKPNSGHPEIGLWFKKSALGKGYGSELVAGMVQRIKENLTHEYIVYETFKDNIRSVKIIEGLGGILHGVEPKENYFGEVLDHVHYRIYSADKLYNNLSQTK